MRAKRLPPDPEQMNERRAYWADKAIRNFSKETGSSIKDGEALGDLLCNMMHWADRNDYDFNLALFRAQHSYKEETAS